MREISLSHNLVIISGRKDSLEREFYIKMTKKNGWSKNVLIHQIAGSTYAKTLVAQTNFHETLPAEIKDRARLSVKDDYTLGFLSLGEEHDERELEAAILSRVEPFLREMGGAVAFVGS